MRLFYAIKNPLLRLNKAWRFERTEGPLLTPVAYLNSEYTDKDVWATNGIIAGASVVMRAETTASSYLYARYLLSQAGGNIKLPLCVWQTGKSFRREDGDGASASRLRFFEFYQAEFQCIYSKTTRADYFTPVIDSLLNEIKLITGCETRQITSDRLPAYSENTIDIEVLVGDKWREMCSISKRSDFSDANYVLEAAVGLNRLISVITGGIK
jgi:glycyl-tRNA synthetase